MKKQIGAFILLVCLLLPAFSVTALADIGPKPSVVVDFTGLEGKAFWATLLAEEESTGPWSEGSEYNDWMGDAAVFEAFEAYQDTDGFHFLGYLEDCTDDRQLKWGYYPPDTFKIALYFPETGEITVSGEVYERYAFDSYFTAEMNGMAAETVKRSYDHKWEILSLLCRIVLTVAVEVLVALLFGFRQKWQLIVIYICNIFTQTILNILLNVVNYNRGPYDFVAYYILFEIIVFGLEAVGYSIFLKDRTAKKKQRVVLYALAANAVSFVVGMAIAKVLPGIF